jgi:hypothetical protein
MIVAVFVPIAIIGVLVFLAVMFLQRGRDGTDIAPHTLFRSYLYIGSLAGVIVLAFGLAALLNAGLAYAAGNELVYGGNTGPVAPRLCPAGVSDCPQPPTLQEILAQQNAELDRRRAEDTVRGLTFTAFGGVFWLVHWLARNRTGTGDQGTLWRSYLLIGTAVFGIATVILLPLGLQQALTSLLVPRTAGSFRQGVGDSLTAGVVSLTIWLLYLRLAAEGLRAGGRTHGLVAPSAPPQERS